MFGLSFFELLAIFGVALLVFGPEKLPEIAKVLGKISGELRRTSDSLRREFYNSVYPPAEELQATYRKLTTSPLAQLSGTCEEKTGLADREHETDVRQAVESPATYNELDQGRPVPDPVGSDLTSTPNPATVHKTNETTDAGLNLGQKLEQSKKD
jgi:TatA/E family protein of Tat protein translocase